MGEISLSHEIYVGAKHELTPPLLFPPPPEEPTRVLRIHSRRPDSPHPLFRSHDEPEHDQSQYQYQYQSAEIDALLARMQLPTNNNDNDEIDDTNSEVSADTADSMPELSSDEDSEDDGIGADGV